MLRNFLSLSENVMDVIDTSLQRLVEKSSATCAFLFERSGYLISSTGGFSYLPANDMSAISAGTLGALHQMLDLAHTEEVAIKLYSQEIDNIYFQKITPRIFVALLFDVKTPERQIRVAAGEFNKAVSQLLTREDTQADLKGTAQFIEQKLDELFSEV